jgi:hypothetical protein
MSYPTTPVFQTVNLQSQSPTLVSESASGKLQARQIAGQRWSFSARYSPLSRSEFAPVSAFIMQQRGRLNTFTIELPIMSDSASSATGTLAANGAVAAGNTVITTDGLTGSLNVGDMVKFNGHDKVYMVVAVSGTNMTSMTIEPPLTDSVADDETIDYNNVLMKVRLNNDVQEFGLRTDSLVSYEVDFIEAI